MRECASSMHDVAVDSALQRGHLYAEGTAVLDEDCHVSGAEGLFDQALTNGLLAIAAAAIPGHAAAGTGFMPPASRLLADIAKHAPSTDGISRVLTGRKVTDLGLLGLAETDEDEFVEVRVDQLSSALTRTQAARHGQGPGGQVNIDDVAALLALDSHPALHALNDHYLDRDWRRAQVADRTDKARAAGYAALLGDEELSRRATHAQEQLSPIPGDDFTSPQLCPVCDEETIASSGGDDFGYNITAGTCLVCSYVRSDRIAYDLGVDQEWETRWADS